MEEIKAVFFAKPQSKYLGLIDFLKSKDIVIQTEHAKEGCTIFVPPQKYKKALTLGSIYVTRNDSYRNFTTEIVWIDPLDDVMFNMEELAIESFNVAKNHQYLSDDALLKLTKQKYTHYKTYEEFRYDMAKLMSQDFLGKSY